MPADAALIAFAAAGALLAALLYRRQRRAAAALRRLHAALHRLRAGDWNGAADANANKDADGGADVDLHGVEWAASAAGELAAFVDEEKRRRERRDDDHGRRHRELRRLHALLRDAAIAVWEADPDSGQLSYISESAEPLLGHPLSLWLTAGFIDAYVHVSDRERLRERLCGGAGRFSLELRVRDAAGEWRWLNLLGFVDARRAGPTPCGLLRDVDAEKTAGRRVARLRDHDALTGLLARRCWYQRARQRLDALRDGDAPALLLLDLSQLTRVNEQFGTAVGDDCLRRTAALLEAQTGAGELLGRVGSDEFALLTPTAGVDAVGLAPARERAVQLLRALDAGGVDAAGACLRLNADVGVACYPDHGYELDELLAKAGVALRAAKRSGPGGVALFDGTDRARVARRDDAVAARAARLRAGLERSDADGQLGPGGLGLLFQPLAELRGGRIRCYDVRLSGFDGDASSATAPDDGWQAAAALFGLTDAVDRWIVAQALRARRAAGSAAAPRLLVRLAGAHHLTRPEIFDDLRVAARRYRLEPGALTVAVDAAAAGVDLRTARAFGRRLRELGCGFAVDRFGAPGLTPAALGGLPLDLIRLDPGLVDGSDWSPAHRTLIEAVVTIARRQHAAVAAPGVDDRAALTRLRAAGVQLGQGELFAPPERRFHELDRVVIARSA